MFTNFFFICYVFKKKNIRKKHICRTIIYYTIVEVCVIIGCRWYGGPIHTKKGCKNEGTNGVKLKGLIEWVARVLTPAVKEKGLNPISVFQKFRKTLPFT